MADQHDDGAAVLRRILFHDALHHFPHAGMGAERLGDDDIDRPPVQFHRPMAFAGAETEHLRHEFVREDPGGEEQREHGDSVRFLGGDVAERGLQRGLLVALVGVMHLLPEGCGELFGVDGGGVAVEVLGGTVGHDENGIHAGGIVPSHLGVS